MFTSRVCKDSVQRLLAAICVFFMASSAWPVYAASVFLVPTTSNASWEDFAFFAAVSASCRVNSGKPCVIALEADASITEELQDFLSRYSPEQIYLVDDGPVGEGMTAVTCNSVETPGQRSLCQWAASAAGSRSEQDILSGSSYTGCGRVRLHSNRYGL